MSANKHKIVLDLDYENLKELRRVLFGKGMSAQYFLSYVAELASIRDPRIESILNDAIENKIKQSIEGNNKADADTLYHMIEQELQRKHTNGAG